MLFLHLKLNIMCITVLLNRSNWQLKKDILNKLYDIKVDCFLLQLSFYGT